LRGDERDDPDAYPVSLPGESSHDLIKTESKESAAWRSERSSIAGSSLVSPSPSSLSLHSQVSAVGGLNPQWQGFQRVGSPATRQPPDQPTRVKQTRDEAGNLSAWIEALGVDPSYRPPPERSTKPVACFYVARQNPEQEGSREIHRAIYLYQRTLKEFVARIAAKWSFDPTKVARTVHVLQRGLEIEMDDDVIRELGEGQDMTLEIHQVAGAGPTSKREWAMTLDAPGESDPPSPKAPGAPQSGIELRLKF
jgi:hypothetical protein